MAKATIEFKIAWWFKYVYLPMMQATMVFYVLFIDEDAEIDAEKLKRVVERAVKIKDKNGRWV